MQLSGGCTDLCLLNLVIDDFDFAKSGMILHTDIGRSSSRCKRRTDLESVFLHRMQDDDNVGC